MNASRIRIAVTGANGQLGQELRALEKAHSEFEFHFFAKADWDIAIESVNETMVAALRPAVVINAGAYTNVEKAEEDSQSAMEVNALGPGYLASACKAHGALLIHISTDYVFDGKKTTPYSEEDEVHPLNKYGYSKLAGERAIDAAGDRYFILRTSWLYSSFGHNFYKTMLRLALEKGSLSVVNDQVASPTYAAFLAADILQLFSLRLIEQRSVPYGIYHYTQSGEASWYDFAKEILRVHGIEIPIEAVDSKRFPTKAVRPAYSKLSTERWEKNTGIAIRTWQEGVKALGYKLKVEG
ncbi:MAG: dTDP-4-dehydrorhamnose reductase [Flavobacteriales bacterium]